MQPSVPDVPPPAGAVPDLEQRLARGLAIAERAGLTAGLAVLDTHTGDLHVAGEADRPFGTASLVKVMIAAWLLHHDRMTGDTSTKADVMITGSDDDAANELWTVAGAEDLEPWIERQYGLDGIGSPNDIDGRWGNTHVTARGLARLYAALKQDETVWPWLSDALHRWQATATDGTDQCFGIGAVRPHAAVKQGWADGSADDPDNAVVHSTGYVDSVHGAAGVADDRYVVVILTEGHGNAGHTDACGLDQGQADIVTQIAVHLT